MIDFLLTKTNKGNSAEQADLTLQDFGAALEMNR